VEKLLTWSYFPEFIATEKKYEERCCVPDENIKFETALEKHFAAKSNAVTVA
jgi:hypothetical protein